MHSFLFKGGAQWEKRECEVWSILAVKENLLTSTC